MLPGIEPRPPTITIAKAFTSGSRPIPGMTDWNGATSTPAAAAIAADKPITIEKMQSDRNAHVARAFRILRDGKDRHTEPRGLHEQPQSAEDGDRAEEGEQPLATQKHAAEVEAALDQRGNVARFRAKNEQQDLFDHQAHRECHHEHRKRGKLTQRPHEHALHHDTEQRDEQHRNDSGNDQRHVKIGS